MSENQVAEQLRNDARQFCLKVAQGLGEDSFHPDIGKISGEDLIMKQIEQRKMVVLITGPDFQPHLTAVDKVLKDYVEVME